MTRWWRPGRAALALIAPLAAGTPASGQAPVVAPDTSGPRRQGMFGNIGRGAGSLAFASDQAGESAGGKFAMAFEVGWSLSPQWRLGLEFGGFLIRPTVHDAGCRPGSAPGSTGEGCRRAS